MVVVGIVIACLLGGLAARLIYQRVRGVRKTQTLLPARDCSSHHVAKRCVHVGAGCRARRTSQ